GEVFVLLAMGPTSEGRSQPVARSMTRAGTRARAGRTKVRRTTSPARANFAISIRAAAAAARPGGRAPRRRFELWRRGLQLPHSDRPLGPGGDDAFSTCVQASDAAMVAERLEHLRSPGGVVEADLAVREAIREQRAAGRERDGRRAGDSDHL